MARTTGVGLVQVNHPSGDLQVKSLPKEGLFRGREVFKPVDEGEGERPWLKQSVSLDSGYVSPDGSDSDSGGSLDSSRASSVSDVSSLLSPTVDDDNLSLDPAISLKDCKVLGEGQFGAVYEIDNHGAGFAFKVINPRHSVSMNEQRILEALTDHHNVARFYGSFTIDGRQGLLFEKVAGSQLDRVFSDLYEAKLPVDEYINALKCLTQQMLEALEHVSDDGIVHCDLKPSNYMMDSSGTVKLIDFGQGALKGEEVKCGHERYCAPEALKTMIGEKGVLAKSSMDSYAVGQMFHELVTGRPFWNGVDPNRFETGNRPAFIYHFQQAMSAYVQEARDGSERKVLLNDDNDEKEFHQRLYLMVSERLQLDNFDEIADSAETLKREFRALSHLVNGLMHPLPEKRTTAKDALSSSWFTQNPVDKEKAAATLFQVLP